MRAGSYKIESIDQNGNKTTKPGIPIKGRDVSNPVSGLVIELQRILIEYHQIYDFIKTNPTNPNTEGKKQKGILKFSSKNCGFERLSVSAELNLDTAKFIVYLIDKQSPNDRILVPYDDFNGRMIIDLFKIIFQQGLYKKGKPLLDAEFDFEQFNALNGNDNKKRFEECLSLEFRIQKLKALLEELEALQETRTELKAEGNNYNQILATMDEILGELRG